MSYTVKKVADIVGVSVRTLQYYDKIGLLKPETISSSGYRLYSDDNLLKLQEILFFKELGFELSQIKTIMTSPNYERKAALVSHRELLIEKKKRLEKIINSVEKTLDLIQGGIIMDKNEMFSAFDMEEIEKHKQKYAEETRQKYGNSQAYKESQEKTSKYTKDDWAKVMGKGGEIFQKIANYMDKPPSAPEVQSAIEEWRQHITESFYNCTPEIFRGLSAMYISDERFTENIDKTKPGLAKFLSSAMRIYCDNVEK